MLGTSFGFSWWILGDALTWGTVWCLGLWAVVLILDHPVVTWAGTDWLAVQIGKTNVVHLDEITKIRGSFSVRGSIWRLWDSRGGELNFYEKHANPEMIDLVTAAVRDASARGVWVPVSLRRISGLEQRSPNKRRGGPREPTD